MVALTRFDLRGSGWMVPISIPPSRRKAIRFGSEVENCFGEGPTGTYENRGASTGVILATSN